MRELAVHIANSRLDVKRFATHLFRLWNKARLTETLSEEKVDAKRKEERKFVQ